MSYLEKIGKVQYSPILLRSFLLLPFLVLSLLLYFLFLEKEDIQQLENRFLTLHQKASVTTSSRLYRKDFLDHYADADIEYLSKYVEPLPLLNHEKMEWNSILSHPVFSDSKRGLDRWNNLQRNSLLFTNQNSSSDISMREDLFTTERPVEVSREDIEKILMHLEDSSNLCKESPQLIIKELQIVKHPEKNYELSLEILQRSFAKHHCP